VINHLNLDIIDNMHEEIVYSIRKSRKAKNASLMVSHQKKVVVTLPWRYPEKLAKDLVNKHVDWIKKRLAVINQLVHIQPDNRGINTSAKYLLEAKQLMHAKTKVWNKHYGFDYKKIVVRNQKSRWGSCSAKGTLNFNIKLIFLPEDLIDYVVVHELCHLKEMNHSSRFWALVRQTIPDFAQRRKRLQSIIIN
jgi:predicted metal-dependent hydrolase